MIRKFFEEQKGGIVLEASLALPVFLAFVVGLILCIQIALLEMALGAGVTEATKTISGQLYPVRILVQETKLRVEKSRPAEMMNSAIAHVQSAREHATSAESLIDEYAAYIPEPLLEFVNWEKEKRLAGEELLNEGKEKLYEEQLVPRLNSAMTPIVYAFCDSGTIPKDGFKVTSVTMPSLDNGGEAFFGIEAQLTYKLPLPFMSQTIILKKRAFERAWVGA